MCEEGMREWRIFVRMEKKTVERYIEAQRLLEKDGKVLVALSGGADSVALLLMLQELGYACEAAHCNFRLRGAESDRDEEFVRRLCRECEVPLHVTCFNTQEYASSHRLSIEMAARELRYTWFEQVRKEIGAQAVAVAHHADDSIETFLLNLLRGTGINGLRGIRPRNGYVVRPLLCLDRADIVRYLKRKGQSYVTDSTNLQDEYMRNKIRLRLLPLMEEINPSARRCLLGTAARLDEAAAIYNVCIEEAKRRVCDGEGIRIDALFDEVSPQTVLFETLHPLGFNKAQVDDIFRACTGQPGRMFEAGDWCVVKDRDRLLVQKKEGANASHPPRLKWTEYPYDASFVIPRDTYRACFDTDKLRGGFSLRLWRPGDVFVPFGMKGKKKISDYLTDRKYSLFRKRCQWVLCCGGDIIWLVGERTDNRFKVDGQTRRVTVIEWIKE